MGKIGPRAPNWTEREDRLIKELYLKENGPNVLAEKLPNRTHWAIGMRARKLGLNIRRAFQDWEIQFIREHYESEGLEYVRKRLKRTRDSIVHKAAKLGVRSGYKHRSGEKNVQYTGYRDISGTFWFRTKRSALKRNFSFRINIHFAWRLYEKQNKRCALTGLPIQFSTRSNKFDRTASLDRIDSKKGYTKENVQWVHKDINMMKQDFALVDFVNYCRLVINNVKT